MRLGRRSDPLQRQLARAEHILLPWHPHMDIALAQVQRTDHRRVLLGSGVAQAIDDLHDPQAHVPNVRLDVERVSHRRVRPSRPRRIRDTAKGGRESSVQIRPQPGRRGSVPQQPSTPKLKYNTLEFGSAHCRLVVVLEVQSERRWL